MKTRLLWMAGQVAFIAWVNWLYFTDPPPDPQPGMMFLLSILLAGIGTAVLVFIIDKVRYSPLAVLKWLAGVIGVSAILTAAIHFLWSPTNPWGATMVIITMFSTLFSPYAIAAFRSLTGKNGKSGSERESLGAPGLSGSQRLEQKRSLGVGEDPR